MVTAAVLRQLELLSLVCGLNARFEFFDRYGLGQLLRVFTLFGALPLILDRTHLVRIRQLFGFNSGKGGWNLTDVDHILETVFHMLNGQLFRAV